MTHGWSGAVSAGAKRAALPGDLRGRLAVVERFGDDRLERGARGGDVAADGDAEPALELDAVGHLARPRAAGDPAHEQRVRQLQLAHQRVLDGGVDGPLVRRQRGVDGDVAVDRRVALEPRGGVRRAAGDHAAEGQRARLGADDAPAGRLGDQGGVEGGVALELGERAEAAVLLGAHALHDDLRVLAGDRGGRVQHRDDGRLHVDRAAAVQDAVLDRAAPRAVAPRGRAGVDDVDVAVEADPPGRAAGQRRGQPPQLVARRLLPRVARMRAQGGEVVRVQVGPQPEPLRGAREQLEHRALAAGDARHPDRGGGVAGERVGIQAHSGVAASARLS